MKIKDTQALRDIRHALGVHYEMVAVAYGAAKHLTRSDMENLRDGLLISWSKLENFMKENKIKTS